MFGVHINSGFTVVLHLDYLILQLSTFIELKKASVWILCLQLEIVPSVLDIGYDSLLTHARGLKSFRDLKCFKGPRCSKCLKCLRDFKCSRGLECLRGRVG